MVPVSYHSSRPEPWVVPRWRLDPGERRRIYGAIRPMAGERGFIGRLLDGLLH